ncbi:DUF6643 family protein [Streptomyces sp. DSM 44915]|uniref:DUF6643 family protein n=1 Tax=Streptomyces chisholmiae TaxID=3075540 RepID=A0ABU2JUY1_9ACTN|nr:DUF6643 family protein [Streptomyces sp. DSM 44915]MDT0268797.1 DUF6643 family protein [Streptomyces sp. DSM 44915]
MTLPRPYGGGYSSSAFPDTPIYDRLVAERGTPQIAPIRVPAAYDSMGYQHPAPQPSLPALPALPSASSTPPPQHGGYQGGYQQQAPVRQPLGAPAPGGYPGPGGHIPQQQPGRPYPGPAAPQAPAPQQMRPAPQPMRPAAPQQMRPAAPRPGGYQGNPPYPQQPQAQQAPAPGYWTEQGA